MLYFTTWIKAGSRLLPHLSHLLEHSRLLIGSPHHRVLIVDEAVDSFLRSSQSENGITWYDEINQIDTLSIKRDTEILSGLETELANRVSQTYESLVSLKFYAAATDILRNAAMISSALGEPDEWMLYHDADVRFSMDTVPLDPSLGEPCLKLAFIASSRKNIKTGRGDLSFQTLDKALQEEDLFQGRPNTDLMQYRKGGNPEAWSEMLVGETDFFNKIEGERFHAVQINGVRQDKEYRFNEFMALSLDQRVGVYFRLKESQIQMVQPPGSFRPSCLVGKFRDHIWGEPLPELLNNYLSLDILYKYLQGQFERNFYVPVTKGLHRVWRIGSFGLSGEVAGRKEFLSAYLLSPERVGVVSRQNAALWFADSSIVPGEDDLDTPVSDVELEAELEEVLDVSGDVERGAVGLEGSERFEIPESIAIARSADAEGGVGILGSKPEGAEGGVIIPDTLGLGSDSSPARSDSVPPEILSLFSSRSCKDSRRKREVCGLDDPEFRDPGNYVRKGGKIIYRDRYPVTIEGERAYITVMGRRKGSLGFMVIRVPLDLQFEPLRERLDTLSDLSRSETAVNRLDHSLPICGTRGRIKRAAVGRCQLLPEEVEQLEEKDVWESYRAIADGSLEPGKLPVSPAAGWVGRSLSRINQAYMLWQISKSMFALKPDAVESVAWGIAGLGLSAWGSGIKTAIETRLLASKALPLRYMKELAPVVGVSFSAAPVILGLITDIQRLNAGEGSAAADLMANAEILTLMLVEEFTGATGPAGIALNLFILISLESAKAGERVNKIRELIHLSAGESLREFLRAFIGLSTSDRIEDELDRTTANYQLLESHISNRYGHPSDAPKSPYVVASVLSLGRLKITAKEVYTGGKKTQGYMTPGGGGFVDTSYCITETVKNTEWSPSADVVYLGDRSAPRPTGLRSAPFDSNLVVLNWVDWFCWPSSEKDLETSPRVVTQRYDAGNLAHCGPQKGLTGLTKEHTLSPKPLSTAVQQLLQVLLPQQTHCHNAAIMKRPGISLERSSDRGYIFVDLRGGDDRYNTSVNRPHLILINEGKVDITGSATQEDVAVLSGRVTGVIDLRQGINTIDLSDYCPEEAQVDFHLMRERELRIDPTGLSSPHQLTVRGAQHVLGRKNRKDHVFIQQGINELDLEGGGDEIHIQAQGSVQQLIVHPRDHVHFSGTMRAPTHIAFLPWVHGQSREDGPILIQASAMKGIQGIGSHFIHLRAPLQAWQALHFSGDGRRLSMRVNQQSVHVHYPAQAGSSLLFAYVTEESYTLFPIVLDHTEVKHDQAVTAALLYVMPQENEGTEALIERMQKITHPTLELIKHASLPDTEIMIGLGGHHQRFDVDAPKKKIFIGGQGSATYVARSGDEIVLRLAESTADQGHLIDFSLLPPGRRDIRCTAQGQALQLDMRVHRTEGLSSARVLIQDYGQFKGKIWILREEQNQYERLPAAGSFSETFNHPYFSYEANILRLDHQEGTTSLDAHQIKALRYSAIYLPYLASYPKYYRFKGALLIAGKNSKGHPIALWMHDFDQQILFQACGSRACRLGLIFGEQKRTLISWEDFMNQATEGLSSIDYFRDQHQENIEFYVIHFREPRIHISANPGKLVFLDVQPTRHRRGHMSVEESSGQRTVLRIGHGSMGDSHDTVITIEGRQNASLQCWIRLKGKKEKVLDLSRLNRECQSRENRLHCMTRRLDAAWLQKKTHSLGKPPRAFASLVPPVRARNTTRVLGHARSGRAAGVVLASSAGNALTGILQTANKVYGQATRSVLALVSRTKDWVVQRSWGDARSDSFGISPAWSAESDTHESDHGFLRGTWLQGAGWSVNSNLLALDLLIRKLTGVTQGQRMEHAECTEFSRFDCAVSSCVSQIQAKHERQRPGLRSGSGPEETLRLDRLCRKLLREPQLPLQAELAERVWRNFQQDEGRCISLRKWQELAEHTYTVIHHAHQHLHASEPMWCDGQAAAAVATNRTRFFAMRQHTEQTPIHDQLHAQQPYVRLSS